MTVSCAWCRADLGTKPRLSDTRATHGICATCGSQMLSPTRLGDTPSTRAPLRADEGVDREHQI